MPLPVGTELGPSEVLAPIGAGGIDLVRAHNTLFEKSIVQDRDEQSGTSALVPHYVLIWPRIEASASGRCKVKKARSSTLMVLLIPVPDWKLRSRSVTSATKTFAKSKGAQFGPREQRKARPSALPIQTTGTRVRAKQSGNGLCQKCTLIASLCGAPTAKSSVESVRMPRLQTAALFFSSSVGRSTWTNP